MTPGRLRRAVAALGVVVVASVPAAPAAADPARPTDQRSEVTGASPALPDGVTARVVGGDAFLELTVDGHEVIVPDYARADGEAVAYLRFSPDGTVEENRSSVASEANRSRYGSAASSPDPDAEPRWEVVATDGRYAWHDHRIHWMSPARAPRAEADGTIDLGGPDGGWSIDLAVDGIDTTLTGRLRAVDPPPVWPAVLGTIAVAAAGLLLARRVGRQALVGVALAAAAAALATSLVAWASGPAHARGS
ncbi:MAG: hypothetical protein KDA97_03270, partial [Acidimicrobiales bacterium]|nr:hypothetical protein [Acidimicrobiales bacterium]